MWKYNPSGNEGIFSTGYILRGGTNYVEYVFDLNDSTSNASYLMNFNVICDTRLWPGRGTDIGHVIRGTARSTSRRNDWLNSTNITTSLADGSTANQVILRITNNSLVRDYNVTFDIQWLAENLERVKYISG